MAESDIKGRILMVLCQHNMKLVQFNFVNNKERALRCIAVSVFNLAFFSLFRKLLKMEEPLERRKAVSKAKFPLLKTNWN